METITIQFSDWQRVRQAIEVARACPTPTNDEQEEKLMDAITLITKEVVKLDEKIKKASYVS